MIKNEYSARMFDTKAEYERYLSKLRKEKEVKMNYRDLHNKTAECVLRMSGQEDTVPVNLSQILNTFNLSALPRDFSHIEQKLREKTPNVSLLGVYVSDDDKAAIFYNDQYNYSSHRCRFTIAHELAHCCIHGADSHFELRIDGQDVVDELEIAANTFAGELLIPEKSLYKVLDELILPSVKVLAEIFDVSKAVMIERLKHLDVKKRILEFN